MQKPRRNEDYLIAHRDGGVSPRVSPRLGSVAQVEQGVLGPSTGLRRRVPQRTEMHPSWRETGRLNSQYERRVSKSCLLIEGRRAHNLLQWQRLGQSGTQRKKLILRE
jgi:hypothetical protein